MLTPTIGGSFETRVKALKGARLSSPSADLLVIQAMGRGTTTPVRSRYAVDATRSSASTAT
jgi:hypothetical protein